MSKRQFNEGDNCLLIDRKGRKYLIELIKNGLFSTHLGDIQHNDLIGQIIGIKFRTSKGHFLIGITPTLGDFTRFMPRIATVIYPKDLGAILILGDIYPGLNVLEAGSGSGSVTLLLSRAVGDTGKVISYDIRQDMIDRAKKNVLSLLPSCSNLIFRLNDIYDGILEQDLDRIVLDLPEPWKVVPHAGDALLPGGIIICFVPTVLQFHELTKVLSDDGRFELIDTVEVLVRSWTASDRSVRPDQRMVSHTGFITTARRAGP